MIVYVVILFGPNASLTGDAYTSFDLNAANQKADELRVKGANVRVEPVTISDPPMFDPSSMDGDMGDRM